MTPLTSKAVATQATIVAMTMATSPPGRPNGNRTAAVHATRTSARVMKAIHGTSHIWKAGRIEMKVSEMPASVPSIAAAGVYWRIVGPMKAPMSTMTPMMNAQASPACQAAIGPVGVRRRQHDQEHHDEHVRHARAIRHRRHVIAALTLREPEGEVGVVQVPERQRDAERRQDPAEHDVVSGSSTTNSTSEVSTITLRMTLVNSPKNAFQSPETHHRAGWLEVSLRVAVDEAIACPLR